MIQSLNYLQTEIGMMNPLSTLTAATKVEPLQVEDKDKCLSNVTKLLDDDWGSLDFTPTVDAKYWKGNNLYGKLS